MNTKKTDPRELAIEAVMEVFHLTREQVAPAVYARGTDPGGWSPAAAVTIHTESSIPGWTSYSAYAMECWEKVSEMLGPDFFCEPVNDAVVAVYEA